VFHFKLFFNIPAGACPINAFSIGGRQSYYGLRGSASSPLTANGLKITKIAISPQRFDRSLQNFKEISLQNTMMQNWSLNRSDR